MKNIMKKLSGILAALLLSSSLAACSSTPSNPANDTSVPTDTTDTTALSTEETTEEKITENSEAKDSLPDNLNFGGKEFVVYCPSDYQTQNFYTGSNDEKATVVANATYTRNDIVQNRLNVQLRTETQTQTYTTIGPAISALVMAGDSTYDVYLGMQIGIAPLVTQKLFINAYDLKYVDYTQPWWNDTFMNEISLNQNKRFLLVSDYFNHALTRERVLFFNKAFYEKMHGNPDDLYQLVLDGKWTLDHMNELVQKSYADVNSDGITDMADTLGFAVNGTAASVDGFVYGSDVEFLTRDKDGNASIKMLSEDAVLLAEKLNTLFTQRGTCLNTAGKPEDVFKAGNALFLGNSMLATAPNLTDMEDDFGFLPHPKMDAEQKEYRTLVHDQALLGAVPTTAKDTDFIGAVLEALSAESYRRLIPVYYESTLKFRYSRDNISTQIIDLINDSMTTNILFVYTAALNSIGNIYSKLLTSGSTDYASMVQSLEPAANQKLADMINALK